MAKKAARSKEVENDSDEAAYMRGGMKRACTPGRLRALLLASLMDAEEICPTIEECSFAASLLSGHMFKEDIDMAASERESKRKDQEARRAAKRLADGLIEKIHLMDRTINLLSRRLGTNERLRAHHEWGLANTTGVRMRAQALLQLLLQSQEFFPGADADVSSWHDVADDMMSCFLDLMSLSAPYKRFGISNPGPATRFVKLALKEVYGRDIELEAIAQTLRRRGFGSPQDGTNHAS